MPRTSGEVSVSESQGLIWHWDGLGAWLLGRWLGGWSSRVTSDLGPQGFAWGLGLWETVSAGAGQELKSMGLLWTTGKNSICKRPPEIHHGYLALFVFGSPHPAFCLLILTSSSVLRSSFSFLSPLWSTL